MTDKKPDPHTISRMLHKASQHKEEQTHKKPSKAQTRRAMRKIDKLLTQRESLKELKGKDPVTQWENEFLTSVHQRIKRYGAAFLDPQKGDKRNPLSYLQSGKVNQIKKSLSKKSRDEL